MRNLVVIPCFNEEKNILTLIKRIQQFNYDYLVINDCSNDQTEKLLNKYQINHLKLVNNMGLANVTSIGFKYAKDYDYDSMIVVDGDGQHPPQYINQLLQEIDHGYDYVIGSRFVNQKKPWNMRMLGSRLLCFLIRLKTGKKVTDPTSGMRAFGKKVIQDFATEMNFIAEPDALVYVIRQKYQVKEIQVQMEERNEGQSYFHNPFKTIKFMFSTILSIVIMR